MIKTILGHTLFFSFITRSMQDPASIPVFLTLPGIGINPHLEPYNPSGLNAKSMLIPVTREQQ